MAAAAKVTPRRSRRVLIAPIATAPSTTPSRPGTPRHTAPTSESTKAAIASLLRRVATGGGSAREAASSAGEICTFAFATSSVVITRSGRDGAAVAPWHS